MKTPCIRVCRLENDVCVGCKRTTEELSKWFWITDDEREEIMKDLKDR